MESMKADNNEVLVILFFLTLLFGGLMFLFIYSGSLSGGPSLSPYWTNRAIVIEKISDKSLLVEVLPMINQNEEQAVKIRPDEFTLIVGDLVNVVYAGDNEFTLETLAHLEVGDIVHKKRLIFRTQEAIDFSNTPIIVDVDFIECEKAVFANPISDQLR